MKIALLAFIAIAIAAAIYLLVPKANAEDGDSGSSTTFVFVKIPESLMPIARGEKYEDPIDVALRAEGMGEVTGGGSQLGEPNPDGAATIEWVGVDVELNDLAIGLPLLKQTLMELGAPNGTMVEYRLDGRNISESIK